MARFRRRRQRAKTPVSWVWAAFDDTIMPDDGTLNNLVLVEALDWGLDTTTDHTRKLGHLLRSIGRFHVTMQPERTTQTETIATLNWAVHVHDIDDTDSDLSVTTGATSILDKDRVIAFGSWSGLMVEVAAAAPLGVTPFCEGIPISWDVKSRVTLGPDDVVSLAVQWTTNISAVMTNGIAAGLARNLIKEP